MVSYATRFSILALILVASLDAVVETGPKVNVGVCEFSESDFEICGETLFKSLKTRCREVAGGSKLLKISEHIKAWKKVINKHVAKKSCRNAAIGYLHEYDDSIQRNMMR